MTHRVLVLGDVDAIKDFVFETSALPQIRGGSQLLIESEDQIRVYVQQQGGQEIYCGGGSFLFEVPARKASEIQQRIERIYLDKTLVATVTVVYEKTPPIVQAAALPRDGWAARLCTGQIPPLDGSFRHRVWLLSAQLREAKTRKKIAPFFKALPFGQRCQTCGKRMATEQVRRGEPEEPGVEWLAVCPVCARRHQTGVHSAGHRVRGKFNEEFFDFVPKDLPSSRVRQPRDLEELVKSARRNYLAFLYADGNDIGRLLQKVQSENEYQKLSEALREGTKKALFESLVKVCEDALKRDDCWPFEIVNVGGDDTTLLIQAGYAWEVAVEFLSRFEQEMQERGWPGLTASCGIAIADVKYPIRYLERLADGLLKEAKARAKADPNVPQSAINFLWLPNPVLSETVEPLMDYYRRENTELTARPYTLEQAKQITPLIARASEWPRAQRQQWGEALEGGVWVSLNTIYYNVARRKESERPELSRFLSDVGQMIGGPASGPGPLWTWDSHKKIHRTALLDVLELAELRAMRRAVKEKAEESR